MVVRTIRFMEYALFAALCVAAIYGFSQGCADGLIMPKRFYVASVLIALMTVIAFRRLLSHPVGLSLAVLSRIIVCACSLQAVLGLLQAMRWASFPALGKMSIGSFDNPAGFASCLCLGLPFILYLIYIGKSKIQITGTVFLLWLSLAGIIVSHSRTGILCALIIVGMFAAAKWRWNAIRKTVAGLIVLSLLAGSCFMKKDSADGRMLIWKCSWKMIQDSPLYGHGAGGFHAHYMDYQARYLQGHPDCAWSSLADNVSSPFSEYLYVVVCWGFVGLCTLFALALLLVFCYKRNPGRESFTAGLSLVGVGVLSLLSYPFRYPFTWIVVCLGIYILVRNARFRMPPRRVGKPLSVIFFSLCFVGLCLYWDTLSLEMDWNRLSYNQENSKALDKYRLAHPAIYANRFFLYDYAASLYDDGRYDEALQISLRCRQIWTDYDLELLIGDIYKSLKAYPQAEACYETASFMCPCRFVPLYLLLELYDEQGNEVKMKQMARRIADKPIKVNSQTVMQIKYRAKQVLEDDNSG